MSFIRKINQEWKKWIRRRTHLFVNRARRLEPAPEAAFDLVRRPFGGQSVPLLELACGAVDVPAIQAPCNSSVSPEPGRASCQSRARIDVWPPSVTVPRIDRLSALACRRCQ